MCFAATFQRSQKWQQKWGISSYFSTWFCMLRITRGRFCPWKWLFLRIALWISWFRPGKGPGIRTGRLQKKRHPKRSISRKYMVWDPSTTLGMTCPIYLLSAVATSTAQATLNLPMGCYRCRGILSSQCVLEPTTNWVQSNLFKLLKCEGGKARRA